MKTNSLSNPKQSGQKINPFLPEGKILVQFDGMCNLCSRTIKTILKADKKDKFIFRTLPEFALEDTPETVIVTDHLGQQYTYFDALLKLGFELGGIYRLVVLFKILPRSWRKSIYKWVARNRFHWFGRRQTCYLPTEAEKEKFI